MAQSNGMGYGVHAGDIMGNALQNVDRLLAMPYGCGEQNMVRFAPNIYIQQYLFCLSSPKCAAFRPWRW